MSTVFLALSFLQPIQSEADAHRAYRAAVGKAEKNYAATLKDAHAELLKDLKRLQDNALKRKDAKAVVRLQKAIDAAAKQPLKPTSRKLQGTRWTLGKNRSVVFGTDYWAVHEKGKPIEKIPMAYLSANTVTNRKTKTKPAGLAVFVFDPKLTRYLHVNYKHNSVLTGRRLK